MKKLVAMTSRELKFTDFLSQEVPDNLNIILYGDEPSLVVKCLQHALSNEDINLVEKIYIKLDDENFQEIFSQQIVTKSLFSEKKIIFIHLDKNRLNKDILTNLNTIYEAGKSSRILIQVPNITKKVINKDIAPKAVDFLLIDCSISFELDVKKFLEDNLPSDFKNDETILELIAKYEGNFSLLINDLELLKLVPNEPELINQVFGDSSIKNNFKLTEHIANGNSSHALEIVDSMEKNDRNSINLLLWMLTRDCYALHIIKSGRRNLKHYGIWDKQASLYKKIDKRLSAKNLKKIIALLDESDKKNKGALNGSPWLAAKKAIHALSS